MNPIGWLFGFLCLHAAGNALAETVTTELFRVSVPDGWMVENDESAMVIAGGNRIVDRMPMPFLSIQGCADGFEHSPCTAPCSEESLSFEQHHDMKLSPVTRRVTPDGVVELRTQGTTQEKLVVFAALTCSSRSQLYMSLVSDESVERAEKVFDAMLSSILLKRQ